jgi:hypothetical protein
MAIIRNQTIVALNENEVFVFGSNQAGIHGAGAAQIARIHFGAKYGVGEGLTGSSYALPTKDENFNVRSLNQIYDSLLKLKEAANQNPDKKFLLTRIGQGYAGLNERQIKPLVIQANLPENVVPWWVWEAK